LGAARRGILVGVLLVAAACRGREPAPRPPNIAVVVLDTVRRDHLPVYGYPRDTAPFLTSLARRSVVFDRAYATSSWTSPAVASLFTSLWPQQHGVVLGTKQIRESGYRLSRLPADVDTLPVAAKAAGYSTHAVSDNANVSELLSFERGFDRFESASDASSTAVNRRIKAWQDGILSAQPYFLYVQYMDVHAPYEPKGPSYDVFLADGRPAAIRRDHVAAYDSEIRVVDEHLHGLFDRLGWEKDTVVIITSDHGEELGEKGTTGHGHALHPELMNVPLIVYGPGIVPRRVAEPVSHVDILPTVRELAGAPANAANEGWSLVPLLRGGEWRRSPRPLFAHLLAIGTSAVSEAVIYRGEKLVRGPGRYVGLFDLVRDPDESVNLADARPEDARRLQAMLPPFETRSTVDVDAGSLPRDLVEQLRALGYIR
jgi:arylsulfatase A-like enzyme